MLYISNKNNINDNNNKQKAKKLYSVNYREIKKKDLSFGSRIITKSFNKQIKNLKQDFNLKEKTLALKKNTDKYYKSL